LLIFECIVTGFFASRCPLWVNSGHGSTVARCPLYPRKRTFGGVPVRLFAAAAIKNWSVLRFGCRQIRRQTGRAETLYARDGACLLGRTFANFGGSSASCSAESWLGAPHKKGCQN
jgi:hypothetical protein